MFNFDDYLKIMTEVFQNEPVIEITPVIDENTTVEVVTKNGIDKIKPMLDNPYRELVCIYWNGKTGNSLVDYCFSDSTINAKRNIAQLLGEKSPYRNFGGARRMPFYEFNKEALIAGYKTVIAYYPNL